MKNNLSKVALLICLALALALPACGAGTPPATPTLANTNTPPPTFTVPPPTFTPTITLTPTNTPTPTATPDLSATAQFEAFFPLVQEYFDKGYISSTEGFYYAPDDISISDAAVGYFKWNPTGKEAVSFIIKTHISMSTADKLSSKTHCGIAFHTLADGYSLVSVSQDGRAYFERSAGGHPFQGYRGQVWGKVSNPVELDLVLIVNWQDIRLFVNEKQVLEYKDKLEPRSSDVSLAVVAGSYEDYGSRCEFTDTELWIVQR